jgi:dCMP deaminase
MAVDQAARCNCRKTAVGAVIARDDRIISTGYNGTIAGFDNCIDGGCPRCADEAIVSGTYLDRCICVHAEQNALLAAARFGVRVEGATRWVTNEPCLDCTKQLIQAELAAVYYWKPYTLPNADSQALRERMRQHARTRQHGSGPMKFEAVIPATTALALETRYQETKQRLDEYVRARHRQDRPRS